MFATAWLRPRSTNTPERLVGERPDLAVAEHRRRRSRRRACPAAARAGRSAGTAARSSAAGSGTAAQSPTAQTFSRPRTRIVAVDVDAAVRLERQAQVADDRRRLDARRPADRPGRDRLAGRQLRAVVLDALEQRAGAHLDAAGAQLARRPVGELRVDLGHDPVLRLDEDPARPVEPAARVALDHGATKSCSSAMPSTPA